VLGIAHFNGDGVARDYPRAHALVGLAAAGGVPQAAASLKQIDRQLLADKDKAAALARETKQGPEAGGTASAILTSAANPRLSIEPGATADVRVLSAPTSAPVSPAPQQAKDPKPLRTKPAATLADRAQAPTGRWRVQLGAYGNEAEARSRWNAITGRIKALNGLTPSYEPFGRYTRLRAGPVGGKLDASRLCASAKASGQDCFIVAP
jgi:cell division septation protein DedD